MEEIKDVVIVDENGNIDEKAMKRQKIKNAISNGLDKAKKAVSSAWNWTKDNKEDLAFLVPIGIAALTGVKKLKGSTRDDERYRIDHTYYDPSTGAHWKLRRELTNSERAELMARRRSGEYTEDILDDMRVLK